MVWNYAMWKYAIEGDVWDTSEMSHMRVFFWLLTSEAPCLMMDKPHADV
jgi:hypothetical protein